jgi:hypothetical protein
MATKKESLMLVRVCGPTEAEMLREMLANNGIESTLQGKESAEILPAMGDLDEVRVFVSHADAAKAEELIEGFFKDDSDRAAS